MNSVKPMYKLPELTPTQEWACEMGCTVHKPKRYENVYQEIRNHKGDLLFSRSEFFWTCQQNHLLQVWDNNEESTIDLPPEYYIDPNNGDDSAD